MSQNELLIRRQIDNDLSRHQISVMHQDGLYRHYRCKQPGSWCMGFDVVTWPGSLCFTGDMGEYLFQRTDDMIAFMRGSCMSYSYAAEKCVAHKSPLKEWDEDLFREALNEITKDFKDHDGKIVQVVRGKHETRQVADLIEEIERAYREYDSPEDAKKAMYESGLWDGCDLPSCETWTFHFLWCLYAIKWFCASVEAQ